MCWHCWRKQKHSIMSIGFCFTWILWISDESGNHILIPTSTTLVVNIRSDFPSLNQFCVERNNVIHLHRERKEKNSIPWINSTHSIWIHANGQVEKVYTEFDGNETYAYDTNAGIFIVFFIAPVCIHIKLKSKYVEATRQSRNQEPFDTCVFGMKTIHQCYWLRLLTSTCERTTFTCFKSWISIYGFYSRCSTEKWALRLRAAANTHALFML